MSTLAPIDGQGPRRFCWNQNESAKGNFFPTFIGTISLLLSKALNINYGNKWRKPAPRPFDGTGGIWWIWFERV
jgi:hypothetical protein